MNTISDYFESSLRYQSSDIDWCEDNYTITYYVVEFLNTISNLPFLYLAYLSYCHWRKERKRHLPSVLQASGSEWYFELIQINFFLIPIFSFYFHATLSHLGQLSDELSILSFIIFLDKSVPHKIAKFVFSFLALLICPSLNRILLAIYGFTVAYKIYHEIHSPEDCGFSFDMKRELVHDRKRLHQLYFRSIGLLGLATIFWVIDLTLCPHLYFSVHWIWHIISGFGIFSTVECLIEKELRCLGDTKNDIVLVKVC